eukprot:COSAG05_NODE_162_length_15499_cov_23.006104_9_plen_76_part_00
MALPPFASGVDRLIRAGLCVQFISDPSKFLSASLVSLSAMMTLELPHINVLSKVDILKRCTLLRASDISASTAQR